MCCIQYHEFIDHGNIQPGILRITMEGVQISSCVLGDAHGRADGIECVGLERNDEAVDAWSRDIAKPEAFLETSAATDQAFASDLAGASCSLSKLSNRLPKLRTGSAAVESLMRMDA